MLDFVLGTVDTYWRQNRQQQMKKKNNIQGTEEQDNTKMSVSIAP